MGSKTVFHILKTEKSLSEVKEATKKSLLFLGGTLQEHGDGFLIKQGTNGINFAFAADFEAVVNIRESTSGKYELLATINWSPNTLFWACLILGIFVFGIVWIVPLLYLFIDPSQAYQQMFFRVQSL